METRSQAKMKLEMQNRTSNCSASSSDNSRKTSCSLLDYTLHQVFLKFLYYLNVVHINAQSISRHHLEFLATFGRAHNIDAILVSETFLKPTMDSIRYSLPGFKLIRNDREGKPGGGVAIYLRQDIDFNFVAHSSPHYSKSAEHLFIEIYLRGTKVLLGVYYNPSMHINYLPSFEDLLMHLRPQYKHILILGDFNTCLLKDNKRSQSLKRILQSYNLHLPNLQPTHFAPKTKPSLLDLIIVSDHSKLMKHGQLTGCFSHHDILFVSYKVPSPKKNLYYNFNIETTVTGNQQPATVSIPLWRTPAVRQALCRQLKAKKILKRKRTSSLLHTYQRCRNDVKKFEDKHKRTFSHILESRRTIQKTKCYICEPILKSKKN